MSLSSFRQCRIFSQVLSISSSSPTENLVRPGDRPISFCISSGTSDEVLWPEQVQELHDLIAQWRADHPDQIVVNTIRLSELSQYRRQARDAGGKQRSSVFSLFYVDPLAGLDPAWLVNAAGSLARCRQNLSGVGSGSAGNSQSAHSRRIYLCTKNGSGDLRRCRRFSA